MRTLIYIIKKHASSLIESPLVSVTLVGVVILLLIFLIDFLLCRYFKDPSSFNDRGGYYLYILLFWIWGSTLPPHEDRGVFQTWLCESRLILLSEVMIAAMIYEAWEKKDSSKNEPPISWKIIIIRYLILVILYITYLYFYGRFD